MANKKISELPYINSGEISGNTLVPLVTYYSATTGDTVHTYITDLQDYLISGLTGSTLVGDFLPLSGGTVSGQTFFTSGVSITGDTLIVDPYGNISVDTTSRTLYDSAGNLVVDWINLELLDSTGVSINWASRVLSDFFGGPSIEWQNRKLYKSGGTLSFDWENGILTGQTNIESSTISATTYQNLPISELTEGNNINISGSNGNYTISVTGSTSTVSGDFLPLSGGTVTGGTQFTAGLTANTISATTYQNLPLSATTYVSGGTYSAGTITFTNTSGGTFEVTGLTTSPNLTKILFVDPNGSDSTGTKGNINLPYLTLEAAKSASTTGDTIYVFPGTYAVTTTTTEGLAKDGITYYFSPGCVVNKSTSGDMFRVNSFTTGFAVYGYGNFNKTSSNASIFYSTSVSSSVNLVFQANDITTTTSSVIFDIRSTAKCFLDFKNASSSAGSVINLDATNLTIDMHSMVSTFGPVFIGSAGGSANHFANCNLNISGYLIETTAASNYCIQMSSFNIVNINVDYIKSATLNYGLSSNGLSSKVTITTSNITGINANYTQPTVRFNLNGYCYSLIGKMYLEGGQVGIINISDGEVNTNYVGPQDNATNATITVSGGKVTLQMQNQDPTSGLAVSGGILTLNGNWTNDDMGAGSDLTGGVLIINGDYEYGGPNFAQTRYYGIKVNGGSLFLNGTIRINFPASLGLTSYLSLFASPIEYNSGKVIINGGTLISNITNVTPIRATASGLSIKVYSAGMNTNLINNGGTLVGKKMKVKFTVSSVASTSIVVNDNLGSGNLTFTETNTAVYNTTALLAQRMVSLINASVTLQTTASQDNPGIDDYFYLEQDATNMGYTLVSSTNLSGEGLVPGMYSLSQSVLGLIIEDTDIE
jgi:hypothetical protein